ncbi:hypothetical protein G7076_02290 [Sphingomonas sp. HDW15A]|uniref:hypothetical protein n=1 Tax=Sphingomonas sp. HDW15A TaxID=2714942 RepID=UPI00140BB832|nr:hypothetical protein [Sphingomonas sp. HDW15A]QIK95471.1 hypothetical protein G7076_02290 [Sphingomonas sp. HDW15A]
MRLWIAAGLLIAVLSVLSGVQVLAAEGAPGVRYICKSEQGIVVTRTGDKASVRSADRTYELRRRPSSIGVKYGSANAALIVDGTDAVFVVEEPLYVQTCSQALPMASAR